MYLYTPLDGRTVTIEKYIVSSTGMQVDELVPCLEEVLGTLLNRTGHEPVVAPVTNTIIEPEVSFEE